MAAAAPDDARVMPADAMEASLTICRSSFILIRLLIVVPKIPRQVPTTEPITDLRRKEVCLEPISRRTGEQEIDLKTKISKGLLRTFYRFLTHGYLETTLHEPQ